MIHPLIRNLLAAMTIASATSLTAHAAGTPTSPCAEEQRRHFDFWLGEWEVTNQAGKLVGRSRIESILDGCVVLENWDSTSGVSGKSFNVYNVDAKSWEQFWVDNSGSRLHLSGGLGDGKMILRGTQDAANPQTHLTQHERITWTPNPDGSVRQFWETSDDDGKTWKTSFDGLYRRAAKSNPTNQ